MTKKEQSITSTQISTELIKSKEEFNQELDKRIDLGNEIINRQVFTHEELLQNEKDFSFWSDYNSEYLKHAFNKEINEYKRDYDNAGSFSYSVVGRQIYFEDEVKKLKTKVNSKLDFLKKLRSKTELLKSKDLEKKSSSEKSIDLDLTQVFIVHGHDDAAKNKTARFIENLGLSPIILNEQASESKTIIEKIEAYSNVGFGIVLYTPCDIGAKKEDKPNIKNRARQNVVFEHGFLIGKIGRKNVCALVKDDIETPNDISGVVYVKMDNDEAWHLKVARELKSSGYKIDLNKLLK